MVKLHDKILAIPEIFEKSRADRESKIREAEVVYIHPEGRFYSIWFECGRHGGFTETRYFTQAELEEGRRLGIFREPTNSIIPLTDPTELSGFYRVSSSFDRALKGAYSRVANMSIDDIDAAI